MQPVFPIPPSYAPKTVQVLPDTDTQFEAGTVLTVRHARASVLCVTHPETQEDCYIRRAFVRAVD